MKRKSSLLLALCIFLSPQVFANPESAESEKDLNVFQMEPSVINEKYYSSGENFRHQNIGKVLPYAAEIPSNEKAEPVQQEPPCKTQTHVTHFWTKFRNTDNATKGNSSDALKFSNSLIKTEIRLPNGGNALPDGSNALPNGGNALPDGSNALPDGGNSLPRTANTK